MEYHLQFTPFKREFKAPLTVGTEILLQRSFVRLDLQDEQGQVCASADLSPLPGLDLLTVEECVVEINNFLQAEKDFLHKFNLFHSNTPVNDLKNLNLKLSPPACFALESLLFDRCTKTQSLAIEPHNQTFKSHLLLIPSSDGLIYPGIEDFPMGQNATVKLKVKNLSQLEIVNHCHQLLDKFPRLRLRIDVNQSLDKNTLSNIWQDFGHAIDYFEGPDQSLYAFLDQHGIPFAIDEDLFVSATAKILDDSEAIEKIEKLTLSNPTLRAIIYKPGHHGGLALLLKIIPVIESAPNKLELILSSPYLSEYQIEMLRLFSYHFAPKLLNYTHGLDTLKYFTQN